MVNNGAILEAESEQIVLEQSPNTHRTSAEGLRSKSSKSLWEDRMMRVLENRLTGINCQRAARAGARNGQTPY
ncbi:hypothetical protein EVAR_80809_1 [Eumeta japonica]|uniref:Uncharacterized protein n=1 Tax=Eumeta variegata TaxID=151549 RepID=A0A4C1WDH0_EUMVA|nr:hypothetical protein EVAR_80809_1 [Eumeta japonica]